LRKKGRKRGILLVGVLFSQLLLTSTLASGQFEFGSAVRSTTTGEVLIVEDFTSAPGLVQWPVTIMYLDLGTAPGFYDEDDPLYLHVGPGPVKPADVRLTYSSFGPAGSKVGPGDEDLDLNLTPFAPPYPRLVYADLGGVIGQYDPNDSVYVKAVPSISELAAGDVRLTWADKLPPGTMVRGSDPDVGLAARLLHPGPDFALWSPAARGQVRFYNANGNVFSDQLSVPIYDVSDRVYFDTSVPSDLPRLFGYVVVPPRAGVIGDFVWWDVNANGIQDEGGRGIPGVEVYLFDENRHLIGNNTTNENGSYHFEGLPSGYYQVYVDMSTLPELKNEAQWWPTEPNMGDNDSVDSDSVLVNVGDPIVRRMV